MKTQPTMLGKLRGKFIALNMTMATAVLVAAFSAICYFDYRQSVENVNEALDSAIERAVEDVIFGPSRNDFAGFFGQEAGSLGTPPEIGGQREGDDPVIPAAVYLVLEGGLLEMAPQGSTATLSSGALRQAYLLLQDAPDGSGELGSEGLYYAKRTTPMGTYLAFADASAASSWQHLAVVLGAVGIATLVLFLFISIFFSRWALKPVERAWDQQQQFVADASHELKTPLTVILANMAILREHPERSVASQDQWVESTQVEAERMRELVHDMLELAKLTDGDHARDGFVAVDFADMVEREVLQFESVAFDRGVSLESDVAAGVQLQGDEKRLHRLVSTLVDNACKYSEAGGTEEVRLARVANGLELTVRNSGSVISPEDLPHVFDRFYRADKARTQDEAGSYGLGLAIAREVAEQHGGTIRVTSSEEFGTTFTVSLPL